jgi:hypothetical protein
VAWMDKAAAFAAIRRAHSTVVTASIDSIDFKVPIRQVDIAELGPRFIFVDWGDSCVSHPFYSLRTVLVSAEISLGLEENSPDLQPLRNAYPEPLRPTPS